MDNRIVPMLRDFIQSVSCYPVSFVVYILKSGVICSIYCGIGHCVQDCEQKSPCTEHSRAQQQQQVTALARRTVVHAAWFDMGGRKLM